MKVELMQHKGKRFLYIDYRGAKGVEDMNSILKQAGKMAGEHPDVNRALANLTGVYMTKEFAERVKAAGQDPPTRMALVGGQSANGDHSKRNR